MKLVKTELSGIKPRGRWANVVNEFVDSGLEAAELTDYGESCRAAYMGIYSYLNKSGHPVKVHTKNSRIYLVRTDL